MYYGYSVKVDDSVKNSLYYQVDIHTANFKSQWTSVNMLKSGVDVVARTVINCSCTSTVSYHLYGNLKPSVQIALHKGYASISEQIFMKWFPLVAGNLGLFLFC